MHVVIVAVDEVKGLLDEVEEAIDVVLRVVEVIEEVEEVDVVEEPENDVLERAQTCVVVVVTGNVTVALKGPGI